MHHKYDIAAYIWPAYTGKENRTRIFWPDGIGEWESVKKAVKKFPEHNWPRKPLWGYADEALPETMEMQIDEATKHGVNVFIYDWYWFGGAPFLENCLNDGFLKAKNRNKMKYYIMWANHNADYTWDRRLAGRQDINEIIWRGSVRHDEFIYITDRIIDKYLHTSNYYCIDGKPVFMIYDLMNLLISFNYDLLKVKIALEDFRGRAIKSGLKGLHLQIALPESFQNFSGLCTGKCENAFEIINYVGFDSITHYQFAHFINIDAYYNDIIPGVLNEWQRIRAETAITYYPHVSIGWDNNIRYMHYVDNILKDNTPQNVEKMLRHAKEYADKHNKVPLVTVNSWNEWTESSYLQPDDLYGYGYLEAVKRVFCENAQIGRKGISKAY